MLLLVVLFFLLALLAIAGVSLLVEYVQTRRSRDDVED